MIRSLAATALCALASVASAEELSPGAGQSIHVADFRGVIYYTVEPDGYRLVATLAAGEGARAIRIVATLGPGQRVVISVPEALGEASNDLELLRNGELLLVRNTSSAAMGDLMNPRRTAAVTE